MSKRLVKMEFTTIWNKYFETLVEGVSWNVSAVTEKNNDFCRNNRYPGRKLKENPIANKSKQLTMFSSVTSSKFCLNLTNDLHRTDSLYKGAQ
jgi:hypothetical protein